jgi:hypothetical protein
MQRPAKNGTDPWPPAPAVTSIGLAIAEELHWSRAAGTSMWMLGQQAWSTSWWSKVGYEIFVIRPYVRRAQQALPGS